MAEQRRALVEADDLLRLVFAQRLDADLAGSALLLADDQGEACAALVRPAQLRFEAGAGAAEGERRISFIADPHDAVRASRGEFLVFLEGHGAPGPTMLQNIRKRLEARPAAPALTFGVEVPEGTLTREEDLMALESDWGLQIPTALAVRRRALVRLLNTGADVVAALKERREEILLHLPMEPKNGEDPGPGALASAMGDEELRLHTVEALRAVDGAVGVNNHMGSALSADPRAMRAVLGVLARRKLFFLDSRTSAESMPIGTGAVRSMGVSARQTVSMKRSATSPVRQVSELWTAPT